MRHERVGDVVLGSNGGGECNACGEDSSSSSSEDFGESGVNVIT